MRRKEKAEAPVIMEEGSAGWTKPCPECKVPPPPSAPPRQHHQGVPVGAGRPRRAAPPRDLVQKPPAIRRALEEVRRSITVFFVIVVLRVGVIDVHSLR